MLDHPPGRLQPVPRLGDDLDVGCAVQQAAETGAHQVLVVNPRISSACTAPVRRM
ncbi:hypothetical protein LUW76_22400 [Actinomadura madurae]|uniref:hypothetical protein n=1 Tax=Actinomadura madurae TaxID=1993 RepID=UPI002025F0B7|nr:hypothetical protein [Actinomadura madurae]URN01910.1 hypothetical protein LUW76_22400 [Actinomadura madurae]